MKAWTSVMKRITAVCFAVTFVLTTFFFTDLGLSFGGLRAQAKIENGTAAGIDLEFYVPECIYLKDSNSSVNDFQYYINDYEIYDNLLKDGASARV